LPKITLLTVIVGSLQMYFSIRVYKTIANYS